jgi:tRNA/rRNA methyltransferase
MMLFLSRNFCSLGAVFYALKGLCLFSFKRPRNRIRFAHETCGRRFHTTPLRGFFAAKDAKDRTPIDPDFKRRPFPVVVGRTLRKGAKKSKAKGCSGVMSGILKNVAIVLVEPQIPENIGATARAMNNMGMSRLILVKPENCDLCRIVKMATGTSIDIVEEMDVYDDLLDAVGPFHYVVGTTARIGAHRPALTNPRDLAGDLVPIIQENQAAILFGPEDRGLSNEHLRYCHTIVTIPTSRFSSLNLAQAVMIICYEIFWASRTSPEAVIPRLADKFELEGMYEHLKQVLTKIGFINPQNPEHWMLNIRRFLSRFPLRAREVRIIRGICRQIDWYASRQRKER